MTSNYDQRGISEPGLYRNIGAGIKTNDQDKGKK